MNPIGSQTTLAQAAAPKMGLATRQRSAQAAWAQTRGHAQMVSASVALVSFCLNFIIKNPDEFIYSQVTRACGQTISENCTFFESTGGETGQCQLEICRTNSNVVQVGEVVNLVLVVLLVVF